MTVQSFSHCIEVNVEIYMNAVFFRAFELEDAEKIYKWFNDDSLLKQTVGLNRKISKEEAEQWVSARKNHNPYSVHWAICANTTGEMIGYINLIDIHYINSSANIGGIVIGEKEYNNGLPWLESYQFVLEYAFERLGLNRVYESHMEDHPSSGMIAQLMFMTEEGIHRKAAFKNGVFHNVVYTSILKDEYFSHKNNGEYEIKNLIRRIRTIK